MPRPAETTEFEAAPPPKRTRRPPEKMDMHTTRRARDLIGVEETEFPDTQVPGLSIRVRKTAATWCLRGRLGPKQSTWTLGPIDGAKAVSLTDARRWATYAKDMLRNGADPGPWLQEQVTGSPVVRTFDRAKDGMLWEEGVDTFLEWVKRERRAATYDDYRKTLRAADCSRFKGRLLKSITDDDIRKVRDDIDKRAPSQAQHTLRILKSCLAYLADTGGSGIKSNPAAVVRQRIRGGATEDEDDESRARVPTIEEVGQLAWNIAQAKNPVAKMGAALVMMTAQRPRTVRSARIQDFEAFGDNEGIWTIPRPFMKSHKNKKGRPHVIPLPPVAWHIVQQAIALAPPGSKWLFPQQRPRRAGDKGEGHISHKPIGEAMRADGGEVTPHELRKAFGTHGEPLCGWTQRETKMVLDHDMGESGDVTAIHYSLHNGTHVTWSMLRRWEAWVLAQTAKQAPIGSGPVPAFMRTGRKG